MNERITVLPMDPHAYAVTLHEGETTTHHRVTVPLDLLDDLGLPPDDEPQLVEQTFAFLLDKEKPTQILPEFGLDVVASYFPDYFDEIRARLGA